MQPSRAVLIVLALAASAVGAEGGPAAAPASHLPERISALAERLAPALAGRRCLVAPFVGTRHHRNAWALETVAEDAFVAALRTHAVAVVDDAPLRARFPATEPGLPPTIAWSSATLAEVARACGADVVLLGGCQILAQSTVTVYVHDGRDGRRLMRDDLELDADDILPRALAGPAARRALGWAEEHVGRRVADGTAAGFLAAALEAGGPRRDLRPPRTIPLPGDVVLWWTPTRIRGLPRPRLALVRDVLAPGRIEVLTQGPDEDGAVRVVTERVTLGGFPAAILRPVE